ENVRRELVPDAITKEDRSPVTVADFGAQAIVCRFLSAMFPEDPVVGEEDSAALRAEGGARALAQVVEYAGRCICWKGTGGRCGCAGGPAPEDRRAVNAEDVTTWIDHGNGEVGSRYWTLDPIDGTKGFLRGDQYAVALALVVDGDVKVGVLGCPYLPREAGNADGARGVLFGAVRGEGAFVIDWDGPASAAGERTPIRVSEGGKADGFRMVESVEAAHGDHSLQATIAREAGITRDPVRMDSQAKYAAVARGEAALYLRLPSKRTPDYRENIWDHAAGAIVVEEAGGSVTDLFGKPLDFAIGKKMVDNRGVVVSNGPIHEVVLRELAAAVGK
ncbi:MAG: 3'(2'),5'-bisphosphate nucleotidase, partial [Gemmatimonadota bacterium]|nr:3'(2'),5'-bisphosphate nucleotidase [Gemmatimonadota bacterium]